MATFVKSKAKFIISNRNGTVIWTGEAWSFYEAWQQMFDATATPPGERIISKSIDLGLWVERL